MPDSSTNTAPSNPIIDRILGRTPSDPEFDKRMLAAKQKMQLEMPSEMAAADIQPTGMFGSLKDALVKRMIGGVPVATTGPFGGITYNKELLSAMPQNELEDTLAHELTHVGQYSGGQPSISTGHGIMNVIKGMIPQRDEGLPEETKKAFRMQGYDPSYRGKSTEMEAYGTEQQRQLKRGQGFPEDIQLRKPYKKPNSVISTGPSKVSK